jgi:hypothetical protein
VSKARNRRRADEWIAHLLTVSNRYDRLVPERLGEVDMKRVVIVGSGLAGLSTGSLLARKRDLSGLSPGLDPAGR